MRGTFWCVALLIVILLPVAAEANADLSLRTVASLYRPVNVTVTTGGILLSYRHNDSSTLLAKLGSDGTVQPFAPSFSGKQEVYVAVANGSAGFRAGDLFLCSGDSIYRLASDGSHPIQFATPSLGSTVEYVSFQYGGEWGHLLYALTGDGGVWAVNSSGSARSVAQLGSNLVPEGIAVGPSGFGSFTGDLLVTVENSHNVVAIPRNNTRGPMAIATYPNQAPERVLVVPSNSDLLVAKYDLGVIVRIPAANFSSYVGLPLIITEGEKGQVGSISVLRAAGTNVSVIGLYADVGSPHFEGAVFVESSSGTTSTNSATTISMSGGGAAIGSPSGNGLYYAVLGIAAAAIASGILVVVYLRRKV